MDQLHKLRLKISTNTNLKFLCTASKDWTVQQLYPHITRLYKEVTADQGDKNYHIQVNTLKKNGYFIPQSQVVGQIFMDNDEVTCNVDVDKATRKQQKKQEKIAQTKELNLAEQIEKLDQNQAQNNSTLKGDKNKRKNKKQREEENNHAKQNQEIIEKKQEGENEDKIAVKEEKLKGSRAQKAPKAPKAHKNPGDPKPVRQKLNVDPELIMNLIKLPKRDQSPNMKDVQQPSLDGQSASKKNQQKQDQQNSKKVESNEE